MFKQKYKFHDILSADLSRYVTIKMERNDDLSHELMFPNPGDPNGRPINIKAEADSTVESIVKSINEKIPGTGNLRGFTLDKREIAGKTLLGELEGDNLYLVNEKNQLFLI